MKRILSLALAILLLAAVFTGCDALSGSPEGTYTVKTINGKSVKDYYTAAAKDYGIDVTALLKMLGIDLDHPEDLMKIVLKEDGTVEYDVGLLGDAKVGTGTWKQEDGKVILTLLGETKEIPYKNGKLTLELGTEDKPMTVVLGK